MDLSETRGKAALCGAPGHWSRCDTGTQDRSRFICSDQNQTELRKQGGTRSYLKPVATHCASPTVTPPTGNKISCSSAGKSQQATIPLRIASPEDINTFNHLQFTSFSVHCLHVRVLFYMHFSMLMLFFSPSTERMKHVYLMTRTFVKDRLRDHGKRYFGLKKVQRGVKALEIIAKSCEL